MFDPHLSVDRALTDDERAVFNERTARTNLSGAHPADVLAILTDSDYGLDLIEEWVDNYGGSVTEQVPALSFPRENQPLLYIAVLTGFILAGATFFVPVEPTPEFVTDLCRRALTPTE